MSAERALILVVDDSPANLALVEFVLTDAGFEVRTAPDAKRALAAMDERMPSVLLLDLQLPGMSGFELARLLKADPARRGVSIIALTAYAMAGDEQRARAAGCDDYVAKPIEISTLPAIVARHVAARPG